MKYLSTIVLYMLLSDAALGQGRANTSVLYGIGIPSGTTADFIDETSFRGILLNVDYFIEDEWSIGFATGVQTFYQEFGTVTESRGTLSATGAKYNYLNSIPLLFTGRYHLNRFGAITPHVGLGAGLYHTIQTVKFAGIDLEERDWQFGLQPELGCGFELSPGADFYLAATYNGSFDSSDIDGQGYIGFQAGFRFVP